ncbi:MAG: hypothetical protein IPM42_11695 [Saprospiraceae bacterium]|nr:hypothetical protein [Saprospiraceae bacterium]
MNPYPSKISFFLLFMFFITTISFGQQKKEDGIKVILKPTTQNSLVLRWAPTTDKVWLQMMDGYITFTVRKWKKGERMSQSPITILKDTVRVWPKARFESLVNTADENVYTMLVGYLMYGQYETITSDELSIGSMVDRKDELTNRFSSALYAADMNALAAEAAAMRYELKDVDLKSYYSISIHLTTKGGTSYHDITYYDPEHEYHFKPTIDKYEGREKAIVISWDKALHQSYFTAYQIERSEDGKNFYPLTTKPYLNAVDVNHTEWQSSYVYVDSVENYKKYHYRLKGFDPFGDLSGHGNSVAVMARDLKPPHNVTEAKVEVIKDKHVTLSWLYDDVPSDFAGFEIRKSTSYQGTFHPIATQLKAESRSWTDTNVNLNANQFYKICVVDTAANTLCTQPLMMIYNDKTPPAQPKGLSAESDSLGVVKLKWKLGKDPDLKGYNVYFSNRIDGVFSILNSSVIKDTAFVDTISLNSLTKHLYYSVVGVDIRDNMSDFSDKVQVTRYDTIPPGPAVFIGYTTDETGIHLSWHSSSSIDLVRTELYRKTNETAFIKIKDFQKNETTYTDQDTKPNVRYSYQLVSVDEAGLTTPSPKNLFVVSAAKPAPNIALDIRKVENSLEIKYTLNTENDDLAKIQFYKSENNGSYTMYKVVTDFTKDVWQDTDVKQGVTYSYKAVVTGKNHLKSPYSPVVDITFN